MAITTKQAEMEKLAKSKVRIKEYLDRDGDTCYIVQVKRWYGWKDVCSDYDILFPTVYKFYTLEKAKVIANRQIRKELNRISNTKTKYYYHPFEANNN